MSDNKQELLTKVGIVTVQDLIGLNDADVKRIARSIKGLGVAGFTTIVNASIHVLN